MNKKIATLLIAVCAFSANAQNILGADFGAELSAASAISALPIASVVVGANASVVAGASVAVPVVLSAGGTTLLVKVVRSTARGTEYLLERASDGAQASIEVVGKGVAGASLVVGTVVTVSVIGAGTVLSAAGAAVAFIPNAVGQALLHNERVTN